MSSRHFPTPASNSKAPRLLIAAHFVYTERVGGAEQMLYNLLRGLGQLGAEATVLCGSPRNIAPDFVDEMRLHPKLNLRAAGGTGSRFVAEQRACLDPTLSADATLFPNYYLPPFIPNRFGRVVSVLHDLQYRQFPEFFSANKRAWLKFAQAHAVRRADRVVVISQAVRQDALRWFGSRFDDRCVVIPNAISWERFRGPIDEQGPLDRPYILSVAAQYPHKNLETLIRAFADLARTNGDVQLVLCGQGYNTLRGVVGKREDLALLIARLGITDRVVLTGYVDDVALGRWYRHASVFAFPSVFEGFGMPPIEALGFDVPTLTTRRTALPETTLGLATYVDDPLDIGEWASKLAMMVSDPDHYRPGPAGVARLRATYAAGRIAQMYLKTMCG